MKKEIYYCDRCGNLIKKVPWHVPVKMWIFSYFGVARTIFQYAELCPDCKRSFKEWFHKYDKDAYEENKRRSSLASVPFNVPLAHGQSFNQLLYKRIRGEL